MIDTKFLNQLNKFSLIIRKRVTSNYSGARRSISLGRGLTLEDYRPYVRGDDLRLLDWKIFARTDEYFIKQFEEERSLTVHIILDKSASMGFGKKINKFDFGAQLGLGFAYLALKENDRFEFSTFEHDLHSIRPKRGMSQLASIVEILNKINVKGESNFVDSMRQYKKVLSGRSLVIIISDFLIGLDEIKEGLLRLRKNDLKVIQILDREEKDLKIEGDVNLHDSETNKVMRTFISRRLREKYQHMLDDHTAGIHNICTSLKADFHQVTTDEDLFDTFFKVLKWY